MKEQEWDKKLKIQTSKWESAHADDYHSPYEPTPYSVLQRLAQTGYIQKDDLLIDYGCGKGRVSFFFSRETGCKTIGVEYSREIYEQALRNRETFAQKDRTEFVCENAEHFRAEGASCFYFFNPFSAEILHSVMGQIIASYYENPRRMRLFFYYPSDDYLSYLMTRDELVFVEEIGCQDLFEEKSPREKIVIFETISY